MARLRCKNCSKTSRQKRLIFTLNIFKILSSYIFVFCFWVTMHLLDLSMPLLSHILGLLVSEEREGHSNAFVFKDLANVLLTCTVLRQAGEGVVHKFPLHLSARKLVPALEAGLEEVLLYWLTRKAQLWSEISVEVVSLDSLRGVLTALAATGGSGVRSLQLWYGSEDALPPGVSRWSRQDHCFRLPEELEQVTTLTNVSIQQYPAVHYICGLPASDLARLSSLTALQSLELECALSGLLPPAAISSMKQLTSLSWHVSRPLSMEEWEEGAGDAEEPVFEEFQGTQHLALCTALRRLSVEAADPVPLMSEEHVVAAWPHLEDLCLEQVAPLFGVLPSTGNVGFWQALVQLPCLTTLYANNVQGVASKVLRSSLPSRLAVLHLKQYSEPALPLLPPTLTWLNVSCTDGLRVLPVSPALRLLHVQGSGLHLTCPDHVSAMSHLTALYLRFCELGERLPASLAALRALKRLVVTDSQLCILPGELACLGSLQQLCLGYNDFRSVPAVLGGGAASRLQYLDLINNTRLVVDDEGLAVLHSLTALTFLYLNGAAQPRLEKLKASEVMVRALKAAFS